MDDKANGRGGGQTERACHGEGRLGDEEPGENPNPPSEQD
jgi:hypothetical protein